MTLIYIGTGDAFPDVPGRDLTDDEIAAAAERWHAGDIAACTAWLLDSGLYAKAPKQPEQADADPPIAA